MLVFVNVLSSDLPASTRIVPDAPFPQPVLLMVRELNMGGCERDAAKIATHIDRSRFTPHVGCFIAKGLRFDELNEKGIPVVEFPVRGFLSPSVLTGARAMARYIRAHDIRLVHPFDVPTTIFGVPVARACGIPGIASQLSYRNHLYSGRELFLLRMVDHISTRIVVNSKAVQRHLVEEQSLQEDLTYLCYNGVDTNEFHPRGRQRLPAIKDSKLVIGIVCALREEKGLALLVEAFAKIRTECESMKLVIVGDGLMRAQLEILRDRLGLQNDMLLVPATSEVAAWMQSMDIFVLPSTSESFANALLEAMACGCCVIGSRVGGTPELIDDQVCGLLFNSGDLNGLVDCLKKVVRDDELRNRLASAAARRAATEFSMERNVTRTEELYTSLLSKAD
jgi:glycosyltransferase involved in cell wall biosynthesis